MIANNDHVSSWKSKGLSAETIKPSTTSDNSLNPALSYYGTKTRVKYTGSCLQQPNISYAHGKVVNIYIVYELCASASLINDPTLKNCLFGGVTWTKNADIDKYGYSGYGIGFDWKTSVSFPSDGFGQNVILFGVDISSSVHIDNKKKDILILGNGPTQGLEHTLTAEKYIRLTLQWKKKKFYLSLHYNRANSYLFVNGTEIYKFKAKDSEIAANPLCSENISKDWPVDIMKKTGFNGYVYDFSVDYDATDVHVILDIHKYLMTKK